MAELSERFGEAAWAEGAFGRRPLDQGSVQPAVLERTNAAATTSSPATTGRRTDASVRPNQILAASLPFAVLDLPRHEAVLEKVRAELLTPVGVRTLAPSDPNYQPRYAGNVASRDRAHHNGSAFPWLLGPAGRRFIPGPRARRAGTGPGTGLIRGCLDHLRGDGLGQLCELFDGSADHAPGGALAAAAAVGELLRCYVEDLRRRNREQRRRPRSRIDDPAPTSSPPGLRRERLAFPSSVMRRSQSQPATR
jgi:glycogen debranching enzyme